MVGQSSSSKPAPYEAYWVPGLEHDIDRDESLALGLRWLVDAERRHGGTGLIVMYAKKMVSNAPLLSEAAQRWEFVSPRSRFPRRAASGPVLAVWPPDDETVELAEALARSSALCMIPGSILDISPWIRRVGATCLVDGYDTDEADQLPADVTRLLDSMLFFGGHNSFLGGGEKEHAIRRLREIARRPAAPSRQAIEDYLRQSGETRGDGVRRAGQWYDEIRDGKRHRDYRGQTIL